MRTLLLRVKTINNPKLNDDELVVELMDGLTEQQPGIQGYLWERVGEDYINIMIYGE